MKEEIKNICEIKSDSIISPISERRSRFKFGNNYRKATHPPFKIGENLRLAHPPSLLEGKGERGMGWEETGTVVSGQDYFAFGEIMRSYNNASVNDKYKFTEKERDTETNYDYFGARYYDSEIGRWLQVDPLGSNRPGLTPYNYVQNNPLVRFDPDGRIDYKKSVKYKRLSSKFGLRKHPITGKMTGHIVV